MAVDHFRVEITWSWLIFKSINFRRLNAQAIPTSYCPNTKFYWKIPKKKIRFNMKFWKMDFWIKA